MEIETDNVLNEGLDEIIHQLVKGNTIEGLKNGSFWFQLERVKEWKSKYGFQFQIYSNDHLIDNKPHFHLVKVSDKIDCRIFFDGTIYDCKGSIQLDKRTKEALIYFLEDKDIQNRLKDFWNIKNPHLTVD